MYLLDFLNKRILWIVAFITGIFLIVFSVKRLFCKRTPKVVPKTTTSVISDIRESVNHVHDGLPVVEKPDITLSSVDLDYIKSSSIVLQTNKDHLSKEFLGMMMITATDKGTHTMIPIIPTSPQIVLPDTQTKPASVFTGVRVVSYPM